MSVMSIVLICLGGYAVVGLIVGLVTKSVANGFLWGVELIGELFENIDFD